MAATGSAGSAATALGDGHISDREAVKLERELAELERLDEEVDGAALDGLDRLFQAGDRLFEVGQCGIEVSEVFPRLAGHVDELAIIRSCHTDIPAHETATTFM